MPEPSVDTMSGNPVRLSPDGYHSTEPVIRHAWLDAATRSTNCQKFTRNQRNWFQAIFFYDSSNVSESWVLAKSLVCSGASDVAMSLYFWVRG